MFRRNRRRKPSVRWLQDQPDIFPPQRVVSSNGAINTFTVPLLNVLDSAMPDPGGVEYEGISAGDELARNPRQQLLAQPGWRMMRCVGDISLAMQQDTAPLGAGANVSEACVMRAGLCIMETDEDGSPVNFGEFSLGPAQFPTTNQYIGAWMLGQGNSGWLWMRTWVLQNFGYQAPAGSYATRSEQPGMQQAAVGDWNGTFFVQGRASNVLYPSMHQNGYFDIKRHVTLKKNQGLFWRIGGYDINGDHEAEFAIKFSIRRRILIARPGREYRDKP